MRPRFIADFRACDFPTTAFRFRHAGDNIGFAAATNLGAQGSTAPGLHTLNPDTCAPGLIWLAELRAATERSSLGNDVRFDPARDVENSEIVDGFGDVLSAFGSTVAERERPSGWRAADAAIAKCFLLAPRPPCTQGRPLSVKAASTRASFAILRMWILAFACALGGERCVQVRRAEVLHAGSAITGRLSAFSVFHSYRNRIWLFAKNTPWPLLAAHFGVQSAAIALSLARPRARSYRHAALERAVGGAEGIAWRPQRPKSGPAAAREIEPGISRACWFGTR